MYLTKLLNGKTVSTNYHLFNRFNSYIRRC